MKGYRCHRRPDRLSEFVVSWNVVIVGQEVTLIDVRTRPPTRLPVLLL
jgi:hypothetical protein